MFQEQNVSVAPGEFKEIIWKDMLSLHFKRSDTSMLDVNTMGTVFTHTHNFKTDLKNTVVTELSKVKCLTQELPLSSQRTTSSVHKELNYRFPLAHSQ